MLVYVHGAKCVGIEAVPVTVEVDITLGIGIHLVGLADAAVKESLLRTVTALQAKGFRIPGKKIVINLAPADLHKQGSGYDLPIALGIIAASEQRALPGLEKYLIMGELGLDGSIRYVAGTLPMVELAVQNGFKGAVLPERSALEAVDFDETMVFGVRTLEDVLRILEEKEDPTDLLIWNTECYGAALREERERPATADYMDFADILGQESAKRGVEIASAGNHNLLFVGAPGSGKSSMAKAVAGILPPMTREESSITSKIWSVAGKTTGHLGLMRRRPFRAPHISASKAAILGGGSGENILPGEVSLASGGVLFADEFCEAPKSTLEALRGPLEDRMVTISR
jgi:Predicted ATPase with chaperone activity